MQIITDLFNTLFFAPIVNVIVFIIRVLEASSIPGALGLAIIFLTIAIRLLIWPLMATSMKSAKKMADLRPHLDELKKKHASDKQTLAAAQMALYKEHGVNPAGGCLPVLIQIPPMIAIYQVIYAFFEGDAGLNKLNSMLYNSEWTLKSIPDLHFFGVNLAIKPSDFASAGYWVILIPVLTGLIQFIQSKMMAPKAVVKEYPSDSPKEKKEKESAEDTMVAVQSQMTYFMPVMIGYIAFTFPIGLALYWNTLTILGIWQQYRIGGWGGASDFLRTIVSRFSGKK
jgi:YidC/Oxa1 family membrane protein insertase